MSSFVHISITTADAETLVICLKQHREDLDRDVRENHNREPTGIVKGWIDQLERIQLQIETRLNEGKDKV